MDIGKRNRKGGMMGATNWHRSEYLTNTQISGG